MNKADLVSAVAAQADLTKEKADAAVSAMIEHITNALSRDESVTLIGFGSFNQTQRAARIGRNPQTGAEIQIKASKNVNFKAGKALKDSVNES
jgi:DNA-binding protein HU-beta